MATDNTQTKFYPPVISVLGHVDHGKTTLLDTIRQTNIATREAGGITQRVGASEIEVNHEGKKRSITFIDTPGHEAFSNMRSQGVSAADIVLLIVAADDGIKPQTKESIELIHAAKIPFIVVFTKSDAPGAQIEKVKQEVIRENILLEGLGGDVPYIAVSAKTGDKIQDLLDLILLIYDLSAIEKDEKKPFMGVVIDSKTDKRRGIVSSLVVKAGGLKVSDKLYIPGREVGKVRAIVNTFGKQVKEATPGAAIELLGLTETLSAGTVLFTQPNAALPQGPAVSTQLNANSLAQFFAAEEEKIKIVLKTETSAEFEAIKAALPEDVQLVSSGQGDITVNDIHLAKDFKAIVLGFDVDIARDAKALAETESVFFRLYTVIYEMLDELDDVAAAMAEDAREKILGKATIITSFLGSSGVILGVNVIEGRLALNDKIRIMRNEKVVGEAKIVSIKREKQDVKDVSKGTECGIILSSELDFRPHDVVLSYK